MSATPCSSGLPVFGERVLIPVNGRWEIAARVENDTAIVTGTPQPAFVWELDNGHTTYHPRQITHWHSLPSLP